MTTPPTKPTTSDLLHIAHLFLAHSGEMEPDDFEAALASFIEESGDKLGALRAVSLRLAAESQIEAEEAARHTTRKERAAKQADRVKGRARELLEAMEQLGEEPKVKGVARLQANGGALPLVGLDAIDPATLPDALVVIRREASVPAIRAELAAGRDVPGVTLGERGRHLRWE